jgi:nitrate reductase gamma subunit
MDAWIDLASGPLLRISLTIMVLGLAYRLVVSLGHAIISWRRAGDPNVPVRDVLRATVGWVVPVRLMRSRPLYSLASLLFHLGVVLVPLLLAGHLELLGRWVPGFWPVLPAAVADWLTIISIAGLAVVLGGRLIVRQARSLTRFSDVLMLALLLLLVGSGLLAAHPGWAPVNARLMLLLHALTGNLVLVLMPLSKIAHCVVYPITQLLFQLGWHFPAETGRHVAIALGKEEEPV